MSPRIPNEVLDHLIAHMESKTRRIQTVYDVDHDLLKALLDLKDARKPMKTHWAQGDL